MAMILASASPRRAELLRAAGFSFSICSVEIDEGRLPAEAPGEYVQRVARAKAFAAAESYPADVVLAADTTVALGETEADAPAEHRVTLGKPRDVREAAEMLRRLSGRVHEVLTGVAICAPGHSRVFVDVTRVWFRPLADADIDWYVGSGEPMDKAGAYGIQGLASRFIPRIDGSYANVVGLPVARVAEVLEEIGLGV